MRVSRSKSSQIGRLTRTTQGSTPYEHPCTSIAPPKSSTMHVQHPMHVAHWFFVAASLLSGCANVHNNHHPATNHRPDPAPVVIIAAASNTTEILPASDEASDEPADAPAISRRATGPLVGQRAPRIVAEFVGGIGPVTVEEARGKVMILDFWATFCAPCRKSFPRHQALVDQFGGDLVVLAVSVDDPETDKATLEQFMQMTGTQFSVVWDKEQESARAYQLPKMPTTFIVDKQGIVRHVHAGYSETTTEEMARQIRTLIGM
jgi:cytochrome c biogenesis protein CcmG, thiol:disulfide interchange protein DsbE